MPKSNRINLGRKKAADEAFVLSSWFWRRTLQSFLNVYTSFQAPLFKTGAYNQLTLSEEWSEVSEPFLFSFSALLSLCFQLLSVSLPCLDVKQRTRSLFHGSGGKVSLSGFDDKYCTQDCTRAERCWKETVWAVCTEESLFSLKKMVYVCAIILLFMFAMFLPKWNNPNQASHSERGSRALLCLSLHTAFIRI